MESVLLAVIAILSILLNGYLISFIVEKQKTIQSNMKILPPKDPRPFPQPPLMNARNYSPPDSPWINKEKTNVGSS